MPSVLQQIALELEEIDLEKARELRRIDSAYSHFGFSDITTIARHQDPTGHLLHYLPRMARMRNFRLYRIGVGERANGSYAHHAAALLEARHLPTPGNTLVVLDPRGIGPAQSPVRDGDSHQYSFEIWRDLQLRYGRGCALINERGTTATAL